MNTNRRRFLSALGAAAVGAAVDPELLAWAPGKRTFFDLHQQYCAGRFGATGLGDWYLDQNTATQRSGISIRMLQEYDVATVGVPRRLDVLYGWSRIEDEIKAAGDEMFDLVPVVYDRACFEKALADMEPEKYVEAFGPDKVSVIPKTQRIMPRRDYIDPSLAAADGFVLTETMPRAEFERRYKRPAPEIDERAIDDRVIEFAMNPLDRIGRKVR